MFFIAKQIKNAVIRLLKVYDITAFLLMVGAFRTHLEFKFVFQS